MRKFLIGVIAGLAGALALASVASADVTSLRIESVNTPAKQDKKVRGPVKVYFESNDTHAGDLLNQGGCTAPLTAACFAYPPSVRSFITFDPDLKFDPGVNSRLADCNLASLVGKSTAAAIATCPKSVVGGGKVIQGFSDGTTRTGQITSFNGAPSGGNPSLYNFIELPGVQSKPILNGVIRGTILDTTVPPVGGSVIEHFDTTLNPVVTRKKKTKSGVKKSWYVSERCSRGTWTTTEINTYENGKTLTDSTTQTCKKKKKK